MTDIHSLMIILPCKACIEGVVGKDGHGYQYLCERCNGTNSLWCLRAVHPSG